MMVRTLHRRIPVVFGLLELLFTIRWSCIRWINIPQ
jgi:hypothetical protein